MRCKVIFLPSHKRFLIFILKHLFSSHNAQDTALGRSSKICLYERVKDNFWFKRPYYENVCLFGTCNIKGTHQSTSLLCSLSSAEWSPALMRAESWVGGSDFSPFWIGMEDPGTLFCDWAACTGDAAGGLAATQDQWARKRQGKKRFLQFSVLLASMSTWHSGIICQEGNSTENVPSWIPCRQALIDDGWTWGV